MNFRKETVVQNEEERTVVEPIIEKVLLSPRRRELQFKGQRETVVLRLIPNTEENYPKDPSSSPTTRDTLHI